MVLKVSIPNDLIEKIQYSFVGSRYKNGVFVVPTLKEEDIELMLMCFFEWCDEQGLISSDMSSVDLTIFKDR